MVALRTGWNASQFGSDHLSTWSPVRTSSPFWKSFLPWVGVVVLTLAVVVGGLVYFTGRQDASVAGPAPRAEGPEPRLADLPPSILHLPVDYDLSTAPAMLESMLPQRVGSIADRRSHPASDLIQYAFEAEREPLQVELRGDTVQVTAILHYRARGWYNPPIFPEITGSCGERTETMPRARVVLSSPVSVGEDWSIETALQIDRVEPMTSGRGDRCIVSGIDVDITEWIMEEARVGLGEWLSEIDGTLAGFDFRTDLEQYWTMIRDPVDLGGGFWLVVDPRSIRHAGLNGSSSMANGLRIDLEVEARPRIVSGARPSQNGATAAELPRLVQGPVDEGSTVHLESTTDYGMISDLAREALRGQVVEAGGRTIRIEDVRVRGVGDGRVSLDLRVDGAVRGQLFLVGTPVYDAARNEITIPDLTFHVETRNVLARAASWILQTGFSDRIRRQARWSVGELLDDPAALAEEALNRQLSELVRMEGRLGSLEVTRVAAMRHGLVVRSRLAGDVRLIVE